MNLKRKGKWEAYFRSMIEMCRKKAEEAREVNEVREAEHHATTKEVEKDAVTAEVEKGGGTTEAKEDHGEAIEDGGVKLDKTGFYSEGWDVVGREEVMELEKNCSLAASNRGCRL